MIKIYFGDNKRPKVSLHTVIYILPFVLIYIWTYFANIFFTIEISKFSIKSKRRMVIPRLDKLWNFFEDLTFAIIPYTLGLIIERFNKHRTP